MPELSFFLWYNEGADKALDLYEKVFAGSQVVEVRREGSSTQPQFMAGTLRIGGTNVILFNGGPYANFAFNESMSLFVSCEDQDEVDRYWNGLTEGGTPSQCGWLKDPFGVSWQIIPRRFEELMSSPDADVRDRVMAAMLKMTKFDVQALEEAAGSSK
jgi:predicted 3-demethylubiquinone-9 3-methyltransferase (glyoxalase superfamily)